MPTPIEELEGRYRCRHLDSGDGSCRLAGQESKRPTMAQENLGERPICRLAHTVAKGTTRCSSCHLRCAAAVRNVRRALLAADPAQRDGAVKAALRNACRGWEPKAPVSNRLPGGAP